ncbi:MAG: hypothetical protein EXR50_06975 [Dehalococcoidia bacterium]|nr:hypothetical protein [Dehalococcoidia bacterium]
MSPGVMIALRLVGMGWYIATCILIGVVVGVWVDGILGTAPIFILIGLAVGLVTSFVGLYRMVLQAIFVEDDKESDGR